MHLLGRSIKVELNPGTARAQTLLDVPAYDFDNQGARALPTPVAVKPGDTYRVTCTHDAALRSQLPALQGLPAALRGLGRRHERRDVPRRGRLVPLLVGMQGHLAIAGRGIGAPS